jgi:hypothetical protein
MMGRENPSDAYSLAPPATPAIINNRQFFGLFDAGLTALATD